MGNIAISKIEDWREKVTILPLALAYLVTPFGILLLILAFASAPSKANKYILFYGITFGVLAYCTVPIREIDITRYFHTLDVMRQMTLQEAFESYNDGLLIKTLLFWIISKTGDNNILPFLSMTTVYSSACYITVDAAKENKHAMIVLLLLQILMIPFYNVYSNVRNVSAFALLSVALYRDLIKQNRDIFTIILYLLPCFLHMTGFIIVLLRLVLPLIRRFPVLGIVSTLGIPTASIMLYTRVRTISLPGSIGLIVNRAIWKAYTSTVRSSDYALAVQEHGSFIANRLITLVFLISFFILIIRYIRNTKHVSDFVIIEGIIVSLAFIWTSLGIIKYWVMAYMAYLLAPPLVIEIVFRNTKRDLTLELLPKFMVMACIINLPLQIYRITRNFDLLVFFEKIWFNNYLVIIVKGLYGLLF